MCTLQNTVYTTAHYRTLCTLQNAVYIATPSYTYVCTLQNTVYNTAHYSALCTLLHRVTLTSAHYRTLCTLQNAVYTTERCVHCCTLQNAVYTAAHYRTLCTELHLRLHTTGRCYAAVCSLYCCITVHHAHIYRDIARCLTLYHTSVLLLQDCHHLVDDLNCVVAHCNANPLDVCSVTRLLVLTHKCVSQQL